MSEEVWEVWGAYHERERLCPEGVRVREIAHVHYEQVQHTLVLDLCVRDVLDVYTAGTAETLMYLMYIQQVQQK